MNRRIFLMSVAGAAVGCTAGRKPRLNVYNWENYIARSTIPDFEREFNCRVRYGTYGSAEEMLAKVMSGNSGWDVVFPSNSFVGPMRQLDLLSRLDHSRLKNLRYLESQFQSPDWDPTLACCIPYMYSGTGIVYAKTVSRAPLSWADLWTDSYHRRVTMLDDSAEVFGACLKRLGRSINSGDEHDLRAARDLAIRQKPLLRGYLNEEVRDQVVAGDVLVAQMWAQVARVAMDSSSKLAFAFPADGFPLYADNVCILRESEHKDLAYEFLDYLLRPRIAAQIATEMRTATVNAGARALLPEGQKSDPVLYPPPTVLQRGEWFRALPGPVQRIRDRYWTEVKSS